MGGVIAPGVNLSLEALHHAAAALPHVDVTKPQKVIGTNTVACMQSGVFWGYVGLVRGICDRIRAEHERPMRIIGTGGLASLFSQGDVLSAGRKTRSDIEHWLNGHISPDQQGPRRPMNRPEQAD